MDNLAFALFETAAWDDLGSLARFRRALRRADQRVLDDLLVGVPLRPGVLFLPGELLPPSELSPLRESFPPGESFSPDLYVEVALLAVLLSEQRDLLSIQEDLRVQCLEDG